MPYIDLHNSNTSGFGIFNTISYLLTLIFSLTLQQIYSVKLNAPKINDNKLEISTSSYSDNKNNKITK